MQDERPQPGEPQPRSYPPPPEHAGQEPRGAFAHAAPGDVVNESWRGAWALFRMDPVGLPLAGVAAAVLGSATVGILTGPLAWGLFAALFARMRGGKPVTVGDIFGRFARFGTSFGIVVLGVLAVLGGLVLLVVPGLYLLVAFMYALPIGLETDLGAVEALRESRRRVRATGFGAHAALAATLAVFGWVASALLDWVGSLVAFTVALPVVAVAYDRFIRGVPPEYEI